MVELLLQLVARLVDSFGHLVSLSIQLAKQLLLPLLGLLINLIFLLTVAAQLLGLVIRILLIQYLVPEVILVYCQLGHEEVGVGLEHGSGRRLFRLAQV